MTKRIFVSRDAGAVAVGADDVAVALEQAAAKRGLAIEIVRTGSRGLYWLEPMIEIATPQGRVAFGPVTTTDARSVLDAMVASSPHPLRLGVADEIPWLKRQTRPRSCRCVVTLARLRHWCSRTLNHSSTWLSREACWSRPRGQQRRGLGAVSEIRRGCAGAGPAGRRRVASQPVRSRGRRLRGREIFASVERCLR